MRTLVEAVCEDVRTEDQIIASARDAAQHEKHAPWIVGRDATEWTEKYAKGRTDADFGKEIGLSDDQVQQRRKTWESFGEVSDTYRKLTWSHFNVARAWDDAEEMLAWADENESSVADMRSHHDEVHKTVHVANNSGENEWYTPPQYIEAARSVMGGIELDPASCDVAQRTVRADRFFTIDDDGLSQEWKAKSLWMNPPYGRDVISPFTEKLRFHVEAGDLLQACALTNNATETDWFQSLFEVASAICFVKGRIKFLDKNGEQAKSPLQGQAVFYFGDSVELFVEHFSCFGVCY